MKATHVGWGLMCWSWLVHDDEICPAEFSVPLLMVSFLLLMSLWPVLASGDRSLGQTQSIKISSEILGYIMIYQSVTSLFWAGLEPLF